MPKLSENEIQKSQISPVVQKERCSNPRPPERRAENYLLAAIHIAHASAGRD
jgi:hypothetical protein